MFAYCYNNPINLADLVGLTPVNICTDNDFGPGYSTAEEAALAFAREYYGYTEVYGNEVGAVIVCYQKDGNLRYTYTDVTFGEFYNVKISSDWYKRYNSRDDVFLVGDIHTHRSSSVFSPGDIAVYNDMLNEMSGLTFYLVGNNKNVYRYNPQNSPQNKGDFVGAFYPTTTASTVVLRRNGGGRSNMVTRYSALI